MSVETAVFLLRLVAGLCLLGFLLSLFLVIWRHVRLLGQGAARPAAGFLLQENGAAAPAGGIWSLQPNLRLGAAQGEGIVFADAPGGAGQARILLEAGQWWLEGGSDGRARLNGQRLLQRAKLADQDVIRIGSAQFRLHLFEG